MSYSNPAELRERVLGLMGCWYLSAVIHSR